MSRLLTLLRGTGAGLALALAFLPAVLLGSSGAVSPGSAGDATPTSRAGESDWGGVEQVLNQQAAPDDDDVPDSVWGVGGGVAGAAIVAALGYKFWLGRRR